MLDVTQAKLEIFKQQPRAEAVTVTLSEANGLTLAEDILSPTALPVFDNSAMDGFALCGDDVAHATTTEPVRLQIIGDIWAGKVTDLQLTPGTCVRIMTGAKTPAGASAVVMQENVATQDAILLVSAPLKNFENMRRRGEEIPAGAMLMRAGQKITPSGIGLLASVGVSQLRVFPQPRVVIIPTGSELVAPGTVLQGSQIYESNSFALRAALADMGITPTVMPIVADDKAALFKTLQTALQTATHVILCGGVSVGDHDHSKSILADCGVREVFWGVKQKPGKPFYFGLRGATAVFGLPGNPASSLVCFYEYVRAALLQYRHALGAHELKKYAAVLSGALSKKNDFTHFIRARAFFENHGGKQVLKVRPLVRQGSHMMTSFAEANCLPEFAKDTQALSDGDLVDIQFLPQEELHDS